MARSLASYRVPEREAVIKRRLAAAIQPNGEIVPTGLSYWGARDAAKYRPIGAPAKPHTIS